MEERCFWVNIYMKYTIYKTINTINGKYYIGKHQTKNPYDNYYGSGLALLKAIKKYGKNKFIKKILFIFDSEEEMNKKEKEIINEDFIKLSNVYNMGLGGEGGPQFKGRKHSIKTKKILSEKNKGTPLPEQAIKKIKEKWKAGAYTDERNKKISDALKGRTDLCSDEKKKKISKTLKTFFNSAEGKKNREILSKNSSGKNSSQYGTCWIYNLELKKSIKIKKEEFKFYIKQGWIKGRKMKF